MKTTSIIRSMELGIGPFEGGTGRSMLWVIRYPPISTEHCVIEFSLSCCRPVYL